MVYVILSATPFVKGKVRTAIYDLQRNKLFFIPTYIAKIIEKHSGKKEYSALYNIYNENIEMLE